MFKGLKNLRHLFLNLSINNKQISTYLLFFLVSFSFWFLSMLSKQHETTLYIPVTYINLPADLVLAEEPIKMLGVRVKSPGFSIVFYNFLSFRKLNLDVTVANSKYLDNVDF